MNDVRLDRKLTDSERDTLLDLLKALLLQQQPNNNNNNGENDDEDVMDLLQYAVAMVSNQKTVAYIQQELLSMELHDVCPPATAQQLGHAIGSYVQQLLQPGVPVDNSNNNNNNNSTTANTTSNTSTGMVAKLGSSTGHSSGNALTLSGALGASRERKKTITTPNSSSNSTTKTQATTREQRAFTKLTSSSSRGGTSNNNNNHTTPSEPDRRERSGRGGAEVRRESGRGGAERGGNRGDVRGGGGGARGRGPARGSRDGPARGDRRDGSHSDRGDRRGPHPLDNSSSRDSQRHWDEEWATRGGGLPPASSGDHRRMSAHQYDDRAAARGRGRGGAEPPRPPPPGGRGGEYDRRSSSRPPLSGQRRFRDDAHDDQGGEADYMEAPLPPSRSATGRGGRPPSASSSFRGEGNPVEMKRQRTSHHPHDDHHRPAEAGVNDANASYYDDHSHHYSSRNYAPHHDDNMAWSGDVYYEMPYRGGRGFRGGRGYRGGRGGRGGSFPVASTDGLDGTQPPPSRRPYHPSPIVAAANQQLSSPAGVAGYSSSYHRGRGGGRVAVVRSMIASKAWVRPKSTSGGEDMATTSANKDPAAANGGGGGNPSTNGSTE